MPGTTTATCHCCKLKVWVAPSTRAAIKKHNAKPVWQCIPCGTVLAMLSPEPLVQEVMKESLDEALRIYGDTPSNRKKMGDVVEMLTGKRPTDD